MTSPDLPGLSEAEIRLMNDAGLLHAKRQVQDKIFRLLEITSDEIEKAWLPCRHHLPEGGHLPAAKISRGENYRGLPYLILDYPALFGKEDIFAFRTMFYWGHFFSATLHLQGKYLDPWRINLYHHTDLLNQPEVYISTGPTPWHYHYEPDNYIPLTEISKDNILTESFVKLSLKIPLSDWAGLPQLATSWLNKLMAALWPD